ncbi:heavy metal translocating P-type ATPase [Tsukamurella sp. 8F]|uniref:heavy metal translocating P-type ATPase n=1 Tax=unclassified Tsukamurella TaxID=2633480 RepID=UPI0023B9E94C|nr:MULTISPECIES: heavy metal translocating P-type ATPase [unclassified Tsukamurella]MDF0531535.1 heavy metal translocating P-type ATPase [Tsukamurella sp. 8J]MDF0588853.1 heavy metal translocating P-type ATPase [Tsukamurella sp. 8F]
MVAGVTARRTRPWQLPETRWATAALALFVLGLAAQVGGAPQWSCWMLYASCYAAGGWEPGLAGLRALRQRTLDVDLLMVVAAIGAAAIGQVMDGALLIVIFATSGALEAVAKARTEDSVRGLLDLAPDTATIVEGPREKRVDAAGLTIGDVLIVRPGERIAGDGTVVGGASEIDQSTITGEALPVDVAVGDRVYAGTLNGTGTLRVLVEREAGDTVVARIAVTVEEASATKARTQLFIEKVEQRYSVGMVVATLLVFAVPFTFGEGVRQALLRAMTFMIVASPCAVVLATMPPLLAAIANASRHGVLVKSAIAMERLASVSAVAFDKTGTLTRGEPRVAEVVTLAEGLDVALLAAAVEGPSEHPLARAIRALAPDAPPVTDFRALPGRGVTGTVEGRTVTVESAGDRREAAGPRGRGETVVLVTVDGAPAGLIALADRVRADARAAVARVATVTGAPPVLLTGDGEAPAHAVAARVGITDVRAGLLPDGKVAALRGGHTAMVGDGVNDAPALAAAGVGIAMGGVGSDLALHAADVVVVGDDLRGVPAVLDLARRARRAVVANLMIAATCIGALVVWDLVGHLPLPLGVAGHEGSTVLVGLGGLRLLYAPAFDRTGTGPAHVQATADDHSSTDVTVA